MSTLFGIPAPGAGSGSAVGIQAVPGGLMTGASPVRGSVDAGGNAIGGGPLSLQRIDPRHFAAGGGTAQVDAAGKASFEQAMLQAMDGVNRMQIDSTKAVEQMLVDPDSIDAHDVTIAMAKANMSLNITRTVLDRVVRAWKDIINTR